MSAKDRPSPVIPDHEVLRKFGGGSYGEVWLAQGVTGALRAVKVVWREDFEDERGFEREFEGILKFEPISRDHPALVNILHVGRSRDGTSFYYYVMELGDDLGAGRDINPIEYEPRTLKADHHQSDDGRWSTNECIDVGLRLAEALDHLHERGLAHRDVKPSNVIFVNGRAKLADIGLVAARGQRTFVGIEGFVPPEGPGSAQADIYSLGKVLYEIATGMDRLNFPELPEEVPSGPDRKRWLELNRIICDVCEPRISKRKISNASDLATALKRIQRGKSRRRSGAAVWGTTLLLSGFSAWAGWQLVGGSDLIEKWVEKPVEPVKLAEPTVGMLRIFSFPEGADVLDSNGVMVGTTPTTTMTARVGEDVTFLLRMDKFRPLEISGRMTMRAVNEPMVLSAKLQVFSPPQQGEAWEDHLGYLYQPIDDHHFGSGYVTKEVWSEYADEKDPPGDQVEVLQVSQNGEPEDVILASDGVAADFANWLHEGGVKAGFFTEHNEVRAVREISFENPAMTQHSRERGLRPFRIMVREIVYGTIHLTTHPPGADVTVNGVAAGTTDEPLLIEQVKPGEVELQVLLEGYKPLVKKLVVGEGWAVEEDLTLAENQGVVFGREWVNGVGMKFAPLGDELMVSIWETRLRDYELFIKESGQTPARAPSFPQDPDHPVVNVSRADAMAFCEWLSKREQNDERISPSHIYRLPTDREWSRMAGMKEEEEGDSPGWRDARKDEVFPWGASWPDTEKVGNFADMTAARVPGISIERTIPGYDDGFAYTSPVGSFGANKFGLFDLSGNVQEWVEDEYSQVGRKILGVLRGGGWNTYQLENLYTGSRNAVPPTYEDSIYGFRVVLVKVTQQSQ